MKPAERQQWILDYLRPRQEYCSLAKYTVNVLDRSFVDAYIDATGAKFVPQFYGADVCRTLGRDLSTLFKAGKVERRSEGVTGLAGQGFPKWVWGYHLPVVTRTG